MEDRLITVCIERHTEPDHVRRVVDLTSENIGDVLSDRTQSAKKVRQWAFRRHVALIRTHLTLYNYRTLMLYHPDHDSYWDRKPGHVATLNV